MTHATRAFPTPIEILAVDEPAGTAGVVIVGWHITRPVDIPLAPIADATGIPPADLPGTWIEACVNCYAPDPADLVVTDITIAPPLAEGWLDTTEETQQR
ncbi:hypothetical protein ACU686_40390 [Yinghuangia aomiensis]